MITTGEVTRVTDFENAATNRRMIENGEVIDDYMLDDLSLILNIKNKGLVILSGCSHAGIVNIIKNAVAVSGVSKIFGVLGGLHLLDASDERLDKTIDYFVDNKVSWIKAGHCTGFIPQAKMYNVLKDKFAILQSGSELAFGDNLSITD
jgi:7,8-dihydropterin-6-yl-methyl-4-(beta-D-ribofuranosyl)aminobenzene 5'-phosphate synthase